MLRSLSWYVVFDSAGTPKSPDLFAFPTCIDYKPRLNHPRNTIYIRNEAPVISHNSQILALQLTANVESPRQFDLRDDSQVIETDFYRFFTVRALAWASKYAQERARAVKGDVFRWRLDPLTSMFITRKSILLPQLRMQTIIGPFALAYGSVETRKKPTPANSQPVVFVLES